jgi:thiol:disulfide interchange protein
MTVPFFVRPVPVWSAVIFLVGLLGLSGSFAFARAQPQTEAVAVTFATDRPTVAPGGTALVAVTFTHSDGFHIHTNAPIVPPEMGDFEPIPTKITLPALEGVTFGEIIWPKPITIRVSLGEAPADYQVFDDIATALVPVTFASSLSGPVTINIKVSYQACNERTCLIPQRTQSEVKLTIDPAAAKAPDVSKPPFDVYTAAAAKPLPAQEQMRAASTSASGVGSGPETGTRLEFPVFGYSFSIDTAGPAGLVLLMLLAAAGGFLLNIMPCVLPVLPLKISALAHAGGTKRRTLLLGLAMCIGIVAFWLGLGAVIALSTSFKSASQIIATWWFTVGIGVLMLGMAVSLLGIFNVNVPSWAYNINPRHDTMHGSFLFGLLTAVLATPCVAPLAATAMGWAAFQPAPITMLIFSAVGVGMAVPYAILAANPAWVTRVPRAGAGSELMKQVLALFMFAVAAFFIGVGLQTLLVRYPYLGSELHWWFVAVLALVACVWMVVRIWQIRAKPLPAVIFTVVGILIGTASIGWANYRTSLAARQYERNSNEPGSSSEGVKAKGVWKYYTPQLLKESRDAGKVVVVKFTATWCINCVALEALLETQSVEAELNKPDVVAILADLSNELDKDGAENPSWALMREIKEVGPPILMIDGPGRKGYFKSNSYTSAQVVKEIIASRASR